MLIRGNSSTTRGLWVSDCGPCLITKYVYVSRSGFQFVCACLPDDEKTARGIKRDWFMWIPSNRWILCKIIASDIECLYLQPQSFLNIALLSFEGSPSSEVFALRYRSGLNNLLGYFMVKTSRRRVDKTPHLLILLQTCPISFISTERLCLLK